MENKRLATVIEADEDILCGNPQTPAELILYSRKLEASGFPGLPGEVRELLGTYNGIWSNGAVFYGADPEKALFEDIEEKNVRFAASGHKGLLLLGEDENDFLVYDSSLGKYCLRGINDNVTTYESTDLVRIVAALLKI